MTFGNSCIVRIMWLCTTIGHTKQLWKVHTLTLKWFFLFQCWHNCQWTPCDIASNCIQQATCTQSFKSVCYACYWKSNAAGWSVFTKGDYVAKWNCFEDINCHLRHQGENVSENLRDHKSHLRTYVLFRLWMYADNYAQHKNKFRGWKQYKYFNRMILLKL